MGMVSPVVRVGAVHLSGAVLTVFPDEVPALSVGIPGVGFVSIGSYPQGCQPEQ